jgi:hypothetical protein
MRDPCNDRRRYLALTNHPIPNSIPVTMGQTCERANRISCLTDDAEGLSESSRHLTVSPGFISMILSPLIPFVSSLSFAGVPVRRGKVPKCIGISHLGFSSLHA